MKTRHVPSLSLFALLISLPARATSPEPRVEVVADLLAAFPTATVRSSTATQIRPAAPSGGVQQPGLFEHPGGVGHPARVEYALRLPGVKPGETLLLAFDYGMSDGVKWEDKANPPDGARFGVEVNGAPVFAQESHASRWQAGAADLTPYAGQRVTLALVVDALANPAYDWALWGRPRLLRFRGSALAAPGTAPLPTGALALAYRPGRGLHIRLSPVGDGAPLEWREPTGAPQSGTAWVALEYRYPGAKGVKVEVEPAGALLPAGLRLADYPARPLLALVAASQAVPMAGASVPLRVEVRNAGDGMLKAGAARVQLLAGGKPLPARLLPALAPGAVWRGEWAWRAPSPPGRVPVQARLHLSGEKPQALARVVESFAPPRAGQSTVLQNARLRLEFARSGGGFAYARVLARRGGAWVPLGVIRPLFRAVLATHRSDVDWEVRPQRMVISRGTAEFTGQARDPEGARWTVRLRVQMDPLRPVARLRYAWQADRSRQVRALWGPNLYVGDGATGAAKAGALFPGLEYLYRDEVSSNPRDFAAPLYDRRTPLPWKITAPLMAVAVEPKAASSRLPDGPPARDRFYCPDSLKDMPPGAGLQPDPEPLTLALLWDQDQRWDGAHRYPSARFQSPNDDEGMRNHRMGLFLPSAPDFVAENADRAARPYRLPAGKTLTLEARLWAAPGPALAAMQEHLRGIGGLPEPGPWPRPYEQEMALCREGFLKTVWNEKTGKWRACIEFEESHTPGFAALLWMDAHTTGDPAVRRRLMERVERVAQAMLADGGPGLFASRAACHIMRWEFPFLYGYLPEALPALEGEVQGLIQSQGPEGGWRFNPSDPQHASLGAAGDSVSGFNAHSAWTLARYARVTGDRAAWQAAEKAMRYLERFRVPRGAGPWECPIYEPDILAAAWLIPAFLEAYRTDGNLRWLNDAVYWAETSLPFVYLWSLPGRPMMPGGSLPVFGSTFYTHSWLAMPVQWEGMTLAYHLQHLAEALAVRPTVAATRTGGMSPLRPVLNLRPDDWRRLARLMLVSGMWQQVDSGERIGTYPDSISDFRTRNPVFINPENIVVNLLALRGSDPDIQTARARVGANEVVVSSGARIEGLEADRAGARFRLRFFPGEPSHTLVAGLRPRAVTVNGVPLPRAETPVRRAPGWWWDEPRRRLYLVVPHAAEEARVEVQAE